MMRRVPIRLLLASSTLVACGGSGSIEDDREPVTELAPGGAVSDPAQELRFEEDPRRLIYSPPVDLERAEPDTTRTGTEPDSSSG